MATTLRLVASCVELDKPGGHLVIEFSQGCVPGLELRRVQQAAPEFEMRHPVSDRCFCEAIVAVFFDEVFYVVSPAAILDADIVHEWRVVGVVHYAGGVRK
jgi:hypothetical protein